MKYPSKTKNALCGIDHRNWTRFNHVKGGNYEQKYPCIEYTMDGRKVLMNEDATIKYLPNN